MALIAACAFAAELTVSARYGYFRDELYFLAAGHHLAFGYVDQPPLTPVVARLSELATGDTLIGLRILPAFGLAFLVVATAAMSRMLGASRVGQLLAALAAAVCSEFLGTMHELTTTTLDFVCWVVLILLVMRLLATRNPRWWLAIGGCVGVASEAKWNIAFLVAGLVSGLTLSHDGRRLIRGGGRYLLAGGVLAAALAAPDLIWQAAHGWPNLAVYRALQGQAWHNRIIYWPAQILYTGPVLAPIWVSGLAWSLRSPAALAIRYRPIGIACALVIVAQFALGGKPYYPGAAYTFLLAAGVVPTEAWLARRAEALRRPGALRHLEAVRRIRISRHRSASFLLAAFRRSPGFLPVAFLLAAGTLAAFMLVGGLIGSLVALPVLPARALHTVPLQKINYDLGEQIAWPKLVAQVADTYRELPAGQRARTAILTGNYGEAGAIDRYGPALGLPRAFSGQTSFWLWGPPPSADTTAIAVNFDPALLHREFAHVTLAGTFTNGLGVADDEQGVRIYIVTGLKSSWAAIWPSFRDYS